MKSLHILAIVFCASTSLVLGQSLKCAKQVISSGGGTAQNGAITMAYTLGQSTTIGASIHGTTILQQGFQTGELEVKSNSLQQRPLEVFVYPNPTTEKITIRHSEEISSSMRLVLFDMVGRVVEEQVHTEAQELTTSFTAIAKGTYQLLIEFLENGRQTTKTLIFL